MSLGSPRKRESSSPVRAALLESAIKLIDSTSPDLITIDMLLENSEVSRGSLYYHFSDLGDLLEQALIARFALSVDESIDALRNALATANSTDEFKAALQRLTRVTQTRARAARRMERITVFAGLASSESLRTMLGAEQHRLTDTQATLIRAAQQRGWVRPEIDAQAIAVLIQAYSLGRVVDDADPEPVDEASWIALIDHILDLLVFDPAGHEEHEHLPPG
jgi:AcrR family transcriptional regulator